MNYRAVMSENDDPFAQSQKVDQVWETPPADQIVELTKAHVGAMETMTDDIVWVQAGMHHILLQTVGRKSGNVHKVALPTWNDPDGNRIVVASFAGAKNHPSWFLNLRDREEPKLRIRVQTGEFFSHAQILEGADRQQTWAGLIADRSWYVDYQAKTDREIPLVRFPETEWITQEQVSETLG